MPTGPDGLAAGYVDEDVQEVARAFTGWSIGDGREIGDGQEAERTGRFAYIQAWHDPYQKRVLGREFAPNRAPMADGEKVLDILAPRTPPPRASSAPRSRGACWPTSPART